MDDSDLTDFNFKGPPIVRSLGNDWWVVRVLGVIGFVVR